MNMSDNIREPLKIIYKYHNSSNNIQYYIFIFISKKLEHLRPIFERFKKKPLDKCLVSMTKRDFEFLRRTFGDKWFTLFFNKHHLSLYTKKIAQNPTLLKMIQLDKNWVRDYIVNYEKTLENVYSYGDIISYDEEYTEFLEDIKTNQRGGSQFDDDFLLVEEDDDNEKKNEENTEAEEDQEVVFDEEIDVDRYEIDYKDSSKDSGKNNRVSQYTVKDNDDENKTLEESYDKIYIWGNNIDFSDTILDVMEKFCFNVNIQHTSKINLTPTRLYFWAEYNSKKRRNTEKICLVQDWIFENKLMDIDIVPSNNKNDFIDFESKKDMLRAYNILQNAGVSRLRCVDNRNKVLHNYRQYIENNEIYCIDIYSQIWYTLSKIKNEKNILQSSIDTLGNFFVRYYFPRSIKYFKSHIVPALLYDKLFESERNKKILKRITEKVKKETCVENILEEIVYTDSFKDSSEKNVIVTQAIFYCNLIDASGLYFNLKNIFNFFILDEKILYVKLQDSEKTVIKKSNRIFEFISFERYEEWNNQKQRGLIFKYLLTPERFITLIFPRTGKLEIKLQWTEDDKTTYPDLKMYQEIIFKLIEKMKRECNLRIVDTRKENIKIKFINAVQIFSTSEEVNHKKLSQLFKYFHSYFANVIDTQRVRNGTYLRYKKVDNYNDKYMITKRILFFFKNYEFKLKPLQEIVSMEFSISEEDSLKLIEKTQKKYSNLILSDKRNKYSLEDYKSKIRKKRGILVSVQGKDKTNYKIRIEGGKSEYDIQKIMYYMRKVISFYQYIYIFKKKIYCNKLTFLEEIFKISSKNGDILNVVEREVVNAATSRLKDLKDMKRNHSLIKNIKNSRYSRECQNSGDKIRRPIQILDENKLRTYGYRYNSKSKLFEKKVGKEVLYALKYGEDIFYICDEKVHKKRKYIGVLSKTENDLPCCFLKNQLQSKNFAIRENFERVLNKNSTQKDSVVKAFNLENIKYIKSLKNKIQPCRYFWVPDNVDLFIKEYMKDNFGKNLLFGTSDKMSLLDVLNLYVKKESILNDFVSRAEDSMTEPLFLGTAKGKVRERFQKINHFLDYLKKGTIEVEYVLDLFPQLYEINILVLKEVNSPLENSTDASHGKKDFKVHFYEINIHKNLDNSENVIMLLKLNKYPESFFPIVSLNNNKIIDVYFSKKRGILKDFVNSEKIDYNYYDLLNIEIKEQFLTEDCRHVKYLISKEKNIYPVSPYISPYPFLKILKICPKKSLTETLIYLKKHGLKVFSYITGKKGEINAIRVNIKNDIIIFSGIIEIQKFVIKKKNVYIPLETRVDSIDTDMNLKFEIKSSFLKNEVYDLYRYHFSEKLNLEKYKGYKQKLVNETPGKKSLADFSKSFCLIHKKRFKEWCKDNKKEIENLDFSNKRNLCSKNKDSILCSQNDKLMMFPDIFWDCIEKLKNELDHDVVKRKEILNLDNYFVSRVVNPDQFVVQENEIIDLYSLKKNLLLKEKDVVYSEEQTLKRVFHNTLQQQVYNDEWCIVRALVTSLYFATNYQNSKVVERSNLGYYSKLQQKLCMHYISDIINFGNNYVVSELVKIPKYIYSKRITRNTFYNIYNGVDIQSTYNLIIYIFSLLINRRIMVKSSEKLYSIAHKSLIEYKSTNAFFKDFLSQSLCINIGFTEKRSIDNINSIFKIYTKDE